ncbi:MAG: NAD(P)(+) transhydrogenase (Re/Si-specific) subunit beta, partial [Thaumarchaeota archaeon]|nr:NAD(P)(+) transhydrogenase (Re/Si-specific) subunit beta [Nitrososphaerota archaeon]
MNELIVAYLYVVAVALFVLSLRWMSEVKSSERGNWSGAAGMVVAIAATLLAFQIQTAVPQRTAMSHAFGSLAVALIGAAEYYNRAPTIDVFTITVLSAEMILGFLTFTGSCVAFSKLQGLISGKPLIYPGRIYVTLSTLGIAIALAVYFIANPAQSFVLPIMAVFALAFGVLLVMGIGGADMPTVIAILNAYAGISAAGLGFVLDNRVLIVAGSLDGSSGFILALIMSQAMNRSFLNVLFGGVGTTISKGQET